MTTTATPIYPQVIQNYIAQIANSDASTNKTIATAGTNGSKIESLIISSTDTSARDIALYVTVSAVNYLLTTINIPANSGNTNAIPCINALASSQFVGLAYDSNGNHYLYLKSGASLTCNALTTVTSGKLINLIASGGDF